jgi:hypothetical protein
MPLVGRRYKKVKELLRISLKQIFNQSFFNFLEKVLFLKTLTLFKM